MTKRILRTLLAILLISVGISHFTMTATFSQIVPDYLPAPDMLVYISGVFEILGGVGLLIPASRRAAAWGLVALFIAVFPANLYQAMNGIQPSGLEISETVAWVRLPMQLVFILWALWMTRPDPAKT